MRKISSIVIILLFCVQMAAPAYAAEQDNKVIAGEPVGTEFSAPGSAAETENSSNAAGNAANAPGSSPGEESFAPEKNNSLTSPENK